MRGKGSPPTLPHLSRRITPAYAGKRLSGYADGNQMRGSPPPMRGKGTGITEKIPELRITPAYAGKSLAEFDSISFKRDHPRLCGEKTKRSQFTLTKLGSPPPMRGKVQDVFLQGLYTRITPAYAGKRSVSESLSCIE